LDDSIIDYPQCTVTNGCPDEEKYNECIKCNEKKECSECSSDNSKLWYNDKCVVKSKSGCP
jgi:hypothetical protein